ncbi:hypothetical protein CL673_04820 [Candidatus Bathyarchaeota archaeon]|nr:hypothetical protein [Candidatus Bathyarchaeota archaeon]
MTKVIAFDWDGVLLDSRVQVLKVYNRILDNFDLPPVTMDFLRSKGSSRWYTFYERMGIHEKDWPEADRLWIEFYKGYNPQLYSDARPVLSYLKQESKNKIALVSNGQEARVMRELVKFGVQNYFDITAFSTQKDMMKPSPFLILGVIKKVKVEPHEVLYVGDTPEDILAAKAAGVSSAAISEGFATRERLFAETPNYLFNSLSKMAESLYGYRVPPL